MRKLRFSYHVRDYPLPLLVEGARYGDENAYRELISRTYKSIVSYCSYMVSKCEGEDLAQEVYARAMRGKTPIISTQNPEAYMIAIAKCVCADYLKSKAKTKSLRTKLETNSQINDTLTDIDFDLDILHSLSEEHKQILIMVVVLGQTYEEVSQVLSIPIGTVRSRLYRAKELSRNMLSEYRMALLDMAE